MSFPRSRRLVTKAEFKAVFDKSKKISQKHLLILFKPNQKSYARMGLVVGKTAAKSAVARNRIKRVVRESFRLNRQRLKGLDIVVIARQQCNTLNKTQLREGIDQLWQRLIGQFQPVSS